MNYLMPSYLIPYVLSGTLAITATLLFGLDRALRLARWPARERKQAVWSIGVPMVAWLFAAVRTAFPRFHMAY